MSDKRYLGNIITQNPTAPAGNFGNSAAKGVWSLEEQLAYQKAGLWPVPGKFLNVEDVFSTYLNSDGSSNQVITNGIDLDGEGGLVWGKSRNLAEHSFLVDSARGKGSNNNFKYLRSGSTAIEQDIANRSLSSFNSNGFTFQGADDQFNSSGNEYVYWTFRKAPKFFDVVTYTGNGPSNTQNISHDLGSSVGMMIVKSTSAVDNWHTWHRGFGDNGYIMLNATNAKSTYTGLWDNTAPTSTHFTVSDSCNTNNATYVAYLFAHNDGDGEFGPDGDADIIKCGSYTGNGSATGPSVSLGFEPQWLLIRNTDRSDDWVLIDSMRGIPSSSDGPAVLRPESSAAEYASGSTFSQASRVDLTATGFDVKSSNSRVNGSSQNMIYIAIRRGTAVPESATDVFAVSDRKK